MARPGPFFSCKDPCGVGKLRQHPVVYIDRATMYRDTLIFYSGWLRMKSAVW